MNSIYKNNGIRTSMQETRLISVHWSLKSLICGPNKSIIEIFKFGDFPLKIKCIYLNGLRGYKDINQQNLNHKILKI